MATLWHPRLKLWNSACSVQMTNIHSTNSRRMEQTRNVTCKKKLMRHECFNTDRFSNLIHSYFSFHNLLQVCERTSPKHDSFKKGVQNPLVAYNWPLSAFPGWFHSGRCPPAVPFFWEECLGNAQRIGIPSHPGHQTRHCRWAHTVNNQGTDLQWRFLQPQYAIALCYLNTCILCA